MQYYSSKNFDKQFKKLSAKHKDKTILCLGIFIIDHMDERLDNHSLVGEWLGFRSISITGDIRAVYKQEEKNVARFVSIGTHSQLYE